MVAMKRPYVFEEGRATDTTVKNFIKEVFRNVAAISTHSDLFLDSYAEFAASSQLCDVFWSHNFARARVHTH